MPQRKQPSRSAEATRGAKQQATQDSAREPAGAAQPPKRNVAMLALSSFLFVIWILFLVYVALFG